MKYNFQYQSGARSFEPKFGRVINATDGGFERGYTQGYTEGETAGTERAEASNAVILADCNAVLPEKGVETADTLEQVPQRIGEIKPEPIWVSYVTKAQNTFEDATFPDGAIVEITADQFSYTFNQTKGKFEVKLRQRDKTKDLYIGYTFRLTTVKKVDITETSRKISNGGLAQAFYYASALEEIVGAFDLSNVTSLLNGFLLMSALREIRFVPGTIKCPFDIANSGNLSPESAQSIIDGLADLTGQTAQTLTFHRDVYDRLTEEQKATVAAKNWTLVRA